MLRLCCKLALALILITGLMAVTAPAIGTAQPPNPALQAFTTGCEDVPQPCWFGVIPGKTTEPEINQLLAFAGEPEFSRTILSRDDFTLIFTLPQPWPYCRAIFDFADNIVVLGKVTLCREPGIRLGDLPLLDSQEWVVSLPSDELIYDRLAVTLEGWPTPFRRVSFISLFKADTPFQQFPWRGFVSQRSYCQRVPNYPRC